MQAAGKRDRRIRLERDQGTAPEDGSGGNLVVSDWQLIEEVWAEKREMSAREAIAATQLNASRTTEFEIGYRTDVTAAPQYRVVFGARLFNIEAVREAAGARNRTIVLTCVERAE